MQRRERELTSKKRRANTWRRQPFKLLLANPLPKNLAEVRWYAVATTRTFEIMLLQNSDAVASHAEHICNGETTDA